MISGKKIPVVLQKQSQVSDGMGGFVTTWNDIETFKALLTPKRRSSETLVYTKNLSLVEYTLVANAPQNSVSAKDRIYYKGNIFDIIAVTTPLFSTKILVLELQLLK